MYNTIPSDADDNNDAEMRLEKACSHLLNAARDALDTARRNSENFNVSPYTSAVRYLTHRLTRYIPDCLLQLQTTTDELLQLEQRGYESAARMHLGLARSSTRQEKKIRNRNVATIHFYARISERPLAFFGTDADELKRLCE